MSIAPRRIIVASLGSHGDVHPFIALSQALQARGHDVRLIAPATYEELAKSEGLTFVPIGNPELFEYHSSRPELWHPTRGFEVVAEAVGALLEPYYTAIVQNHQPGKTILVLSSLALSGRVAQEVLNVPTITVHLSPAILRSARNPAKTPPVPVASWMPRVWNRFIFRMVDLLIVDRVLARPLSEFRKSLGLPPVHRILNQWIHSPDRVIGLFPPWFAPPPDDWPAQTVLTGFPLYDEADVTPLDPELQDFLKAGEPPLAFTPGSAMRHGDEFFAVAVDVCRKLGRRGLLLSRHDRHMPADLPAGVRHVAYVPFSRLLPHCAALIHHGGIGTSAQALAAGIPQLVVPMSHDQPDNAMKLHELGVAEIVPAGRFSTARATVAISRLMDSNHRAACLEIKKRFVGADPISETATLIEGVIRD